MIRLICPLLLISTILCASLHAETKAAKAPAPAKSFAFGPPENIKPGAYDVKLKLIGEYSTSYAPPGDPPVKYRGSQTALAECTVAVMPANKKQEQVLTLTFQRHQEWTKQVFTTAKRGTKRKTTSFDSRHPKQAKGMKCVAKRMSVMGKKARWTLCKGAVVKRDGFEQLRSKAEPPILDTAESNVADYKAKRAAYDDARSANQLIDLEKRLFPQYPRTLLPVKPMKVGDTWKRKVDLAQWVGPSAEKASIPAKVTCTLSKVEGTVATVTFSLEIPPCTYTYEGRATTAIGTKKGKGSIQYDLATQLIMTAQIAFTFEAVSLEKGEDLPSEPTTIQFQRTLTITPKKTKAKAAPTKKPTD